MECTIAIGHFRSYSISKAQCCREHFDCGSWKNARGSMVNERSDGPQFPAQGSCGPKVLLNHFRFLWRRYRGYSRWETPHWPRKHCIRKKLLADVAYWERIEFRDARISRQPCSSLGCNLFCGTARRSGAAALRKRHSIDRAQGSCRSTGKSDIWGECAHSSQDNWAKTGRPYQRLDK